MSNSVLRYGVTPSLGMLGGGRAGLVREGGAGEDRVWGEEVSDWHPLGEQRGQQL